MKHPSFVGACYDVYLSFEPTSYRELFVTFSPDEGGPRHFPWSFVRDKRLDDLTTIDLFLTHYPRYSLMTACTVPSNLQPQLCYTLPSLKIDAFNSTGCPGRGTRLQNGTTSSDFGFVLGLLPPVPHVPNHIFTLRHSQGWRSGTCLHLLFLEPTPSKQKIIGSEK